MNTQKRARSAVIQWSVLAATAEVAAIGCDASRTAAVGRNALITGM
jgi:hypothetical protein